MKEAILVWINQLAELLVKIGIPEEHSVMGALGTLYFLLTLLVLLIVVLMLRKRTRKTVLPAEEEKTEHVAVESVVEPEGEEAAAEAGEEEGGEEDLGEPAPPTEAPVSSVEPPEESAARSVEVSEARPEPLPETPQSLIERMRKGLAKTQSAVLGRIDSLLKSHKGEDAELLEELEEILISADFGMKTTMELTAAIEKRLAKGGTPRHEAVRDVLREEIRQRLRLEAAPLDFSTTSPYVIMVVGVNGVGKTTTIGKLAKQLTSQGKRVVLGAGDTFRAAAAQQLSVWGERAGAEVIRHDEGADPAAVAFDAIKAAIARKADVLILDTAGRLHTKVNLMEEMKKIRRVLHRELPGAPQETLLVLDATTGQNALVQARLFKEAVEVSGIALTKLDGTAKGGMVVAIGSELDLPVRFVGIGEGVDDLRTFDPDLFVEALFQRN